MQLLHKKKRAWYYRASFFLGAFVILITFIQIHASTGIFQPEKIDDRDQKSWSRTNGIINGAEEFTYVGKNETCWLLIHSYAASPGEMRGLADAIYTRFGDTVVGIRLDGHGELPSKLENKNLTHWYSQVNVQVEEGMQYCKKLNVVGSSLGGVLALRVAQEHDINNLYVLNPFLTKTHVWYKILPFELRLRLLSELFRYDKKTKIANINDIEGMNKHIAYWNMPYAPLRTSLPFIKETRKQIPKITEPIFIAHSKYDRVAAFSGAREIHAQTSSASKEIFIVNKSNHVLLLDYDREEVINKVLAFEDLHR